MQTNLKPLALIASLAVIFMVNPVMPLQAAEVDFSCMKDRVREKIQVSGRFKEFDVILENHCPGPVYWSVCIERMDPWTSKKLETLTPSGQVQAEKKTRVNLRMSRLSEESDPQAVFEEFYLSITYALDPTLKAQCVASACESQKRDLRVEFRANKQARQKVNKALAARIATECPDSGWGGTQQADCEADIRQASQSELDQFAQQEKELKEKLTEVDPERCQVYRGG